MVDVASQPMCIASVVIAGCRDKKGVRMQLIIGERVSLDMRIVRESAFLAANQIGIVLLPLSETR